MSKIMITLDRIIEHHPCKEGWDALINGRKALFPDWDPTTPFPLAEGFQTNTFNDVLWAMQHMHEHEALWRLFALWCLGQAFREAPQNDLVGYLHAKLSDLMWVLEGGVPKTHREFVLRPVLEGFYKQNLSPDRFVVEQCLCRGLVTATYEGPGTFLSPVGWAVSALCRIRWPEWSELAHRDHVQRIKVINDLFQDKLIVLLERPESITHMRGTRQYVESAA